MSQIIIRRVKKSHYELEIDGDVVQTYNQTIMTHPTDWATDAKNNGATDKDIQTGNFDYIDQR